MSNFADVVAVTVAVIFVVFIFNDDDKSVIILTKYHDGILVGCAKIGMGSYGKCYSLCHS
jgi:hypothetical protein